MPSLLKAGSKILSVVLAISTIALISVTDSSYAGNHSADGSTEFAPSRVATSKNLSSPDDLESRLESVSPGYVQPPIDPSYLLQGGSSPLLTRATASFPSCYDLREQQEICEAVRNQAAWGTCWAFAAVGSAESSLYPEDTTVFSPRHLAYFAYNGAANPHTPEDGTAGDTFHPWSYPSNDSRFYWYPWYEFGGNTFLATATLARIGVQTEEVVPYPDSYQYFGTEIDSFGTPALKDAYTALYGNVSEAFHFTAPYRLVESNYLPTRDSFGNLNGNAIKQALLEGSCIVVAYASNQYNTYTLPDGEQIVAQAYNGPNRVAVNHEVQIIGWNDTIPKESFCTSWTNGEPTGNMPSNDGGWLIRNNWGNHWGMDGCFYLSYEDSSISETCQFIASADPSYDHLYQYDGTGWNTTVGIRDKPTAPVSMANVFTATGQQSIQAVSFYTTMPDAQYSIQVYTGLQKSDVPDSGVPAFFKEQKGWEPYAGYHTIALQQPVSIQSGEPFSIVVKLENPTSNGLTDSNGPIYPIACEGNGPCNGIFSDAAIAPGQSFLRGSNGTWLDLADFQESTYVSSGIHNLTLGNVCLKAFTTDEPLGSVTYATGNGLDKL